MIWTKSGRRYRVDQFGYLYEHDGHVWRLFGFVDAVHREVAHW